MQGGAHDRPHERAYRKETFRRIALLSLCGAPPFIEGKVKTKALMVGVEESKPHISFKPPPKDLAGGRPAKMAAGELAAKPLAHP